MPWYDFIKNFLKNSIEGLGIHTIVTDGCGAYPKIIDELGLIQQRYKCPYYVKWMS